MPVEFTATVPRLAYILTPPTAPNIALQLAVLAHPHPRFGGSKNDAILRILARELGAKGWWTLRYDSRGAGESEGSCSFSAQPEISDHTELIESIFRPLIDDHKNNDQITLLQIGYSYGCLATSLSTPTLRHHTPGQAIRRRTVLMSYPLSVLFAITLFRSAYFVNGLEERVKLEQSIQDDTRGTGEGGTVCSTAGEETKNKGNDLLIIYGDQDQFTAVEKLRDWSNRLEEIGRDTVRTVEIAGDHFWREEKGRGELFTALFDWLEC